MTHKNSISEPNNIQGQFEQALRVLSEKLEHFHCPICHAERGIRFYDEPYFAMHFDWNKETTPWSITTAKGTGKPSVMGRCNNCGYEMMFDISVASEQYKRMEVVEEREYIRATITQTTTSKDASH